MATWQYSGPYLDGSGNNLTILQQIPAAYKIGEIYEIDGRKWRCEKIEQY
jgi:hypothetical protein